MSLLFLLQAFNYIDSEGTHVISKDEFTTENTKEVLEYWLGSCDDWEEEFDNIDLTNKKGEGNVLFRVRKILHTYDTVLSPCHYKRPCLFFIRFAGIFWLGHSQKHWPPRRYGSQFRISFQLGTTISRLALCNMELYITFNVWCLICNDAFIIT